MGGLIRFELKKLLAERKSLLGLLDIVLINLLISVALTLRQAKHGNRPHELLPAHTVNEVINAYFYTQTILAPCVYMLFPLVLAVMGSYILAGELELGNARMMLIRPVRRWQILGAKFVALTAYSAAMLAILLLVSYPAACLQFRPTGIVMVHGPLYMLRGTFVIPEAMAPGRILLSYLMALPMLMSVAAMALMFATIMRHFTAASILTATVYFASYIVAGIPLLSAIWPYLPNRYWPFWKFALMPDIPWGSVLQYGLWTAGYTAVFLALASLVFSLRDV